MSTSQIHRRELIQTLDGLKARLESDDAGCGCDFFEDLGQANRFLWQEWWSSKDAADRARSSERFRALLGAVKVLGTLESVRSVRHRSDSDAGLDPQSPIEHDA